MKTSSKFLFVLITGLMTSSVALADPPAGGAGTGENRSGNCPRGTDRRDGRGGDTAGGGQTPAVNSGTAAGGVTAGTGTTVPANP